MLIFQVIFMFEAVPKQLKILYSSRICLCSKFQTSGTAYQNYSGWGGKHVVIMLASPAQLGLGLSLAKTVHYSRKCFNLIQCCLKFLKKWDCNCMIYNVRQQTVQSQSTLLLEQTSLQIIGRQYILYSEAVICQKLNGCLPSFNLRILQYIS